MTNILHISPNFNYACGVSKYVYLMLKYFKEKEGYNLHFITNGGDALGRLKTIGIEPKILNFGTGIKNALNYNQNLLDLNEYCETNKIDIIHTHHRYPELLSVKIPHKCKTISTCHSFVSGFKFLSFKSQKLIAVSSAVKEHLVEDFNVLDSKIKMMHNFVLPPEINAEDVQMLKNALGITNQHFVFFFAGRSSKIKGLKYLINAFNILKDEYSNILLLLVSPEDANLNSMINENPYRIVRVDPVNNIFPLMSLSNVIVLPSIKDPFPYLMLEAGIMKKPFVGSRVDGIEEFIENGINGLLASPGDSGELYFQLKRCVENKLLCEKISQSLYDKVIRISPDTYINKLESIYNELLNE